MARQEASIRYPAALGDRLGAVIAACAPGRVVQIAPGKYEESLRLDRALTLKGAGDLTRLFGVGRSVIVVDADPAEPVRLESLSIEAGDAEYGGGILVLRGRLELVNVRIVRSRARFGGAIAVRSGEVEARAIRIEAVEAEQGGALWIGPDGALDLVEAQISGARAGEGGAISVDGRLWLESVTIQRARATARDGGQVMLVSGEHADVALSRVRFADPPLGRPLVHRGAGLIAVGGCDLPRMVAREPGIADRGENRWR